MSKTEDGPSSEEATEAGRGVLDWSGRFRRADVEATAGQGENPSVGDRVERVVQDVEALTLTGIPRVLVVDSGREFESRAFREACVRMGITVRIKAGP